VFKISVSVMILVSLPLIFNTYKYIYVCVFMYDVGIDINTHPTYLQINWCLNFIINNGFSIIIDNILHIQIHVYVFVRLRACTYMSMNVYMWYYIYHTHIYTLSTIPIYFGNIVSDFRYPIWYWSYSSTDINTHIYIHLPTHTCR